MSIIDNNTSYTCKDFQAIYDELLELIPTLTGKWNPTNEADPMVVIVKLMAILGDKLNYNQDKQVLELFPGSVHQRANARSIFNTIGYSLKWYNSATLRVAFKVNEFLASESGDIYSVRIPRFTQLTDANKSISYITLSEVTLDGSNTIKTYEVEAMQGNIIDLRVNNSTEIKLSSLDENYRIYLSDVNVAENGIFVSDSGTDVYDWRQVSNVSAYPLGSKVFEFGVTADESQCYIQFPKDVNNVSMSDSISIKYIVSSGNDGNIIANTLVNFANDLVAEEDNSVVVTPNITIIQSTSSTNGRNPETIEEAYRNYKSVLGTFDTLITKNDFKNYINALYNDNQKAVSNIAVADRSNDPASVIDIVTCENWEERHVKAVKYAADGVPEVTPYTLMLYMLNASSDYNESFKPIKNQAKLLEINAMLDQAKAINIDLSIPNGDYLFKGIFTLSGQLITAEKVTPAEAKDIENIVLDGLKQKYSAYNVSFGQQIDYAEVIDTIQSLDARIKAVSLNDVKYKVVKATDSRDVPLDADDKLELTARTVMAGKANLFVKDDTHNYLMGRSTTRYDKKYIGTSLQLTAGTNGVTLERGDVITLFAPKVIVTEQYSSGVYIFWTPKAEFNELNDGDLPTGVTRSQVNTTVYSLGANLNFVVGDAAGDSIGQVKVRWVDSSGITNEKDLPAGCIVKCTKVITNSSQGEIITAGNTLYVYQESKQTLPVGTQYALRLNTDAILSPDTTKISVDASGKYITIASQGEFLLNVNDALYYTKRNSTGIVKVGSGFTIKNTGTTNLVLNLLPNQIENYNDETFYSSLGSGGELTLIDNNIVTAGEGCVVKCANSSFVIDGSLKQLTSTDEITINDENGETSYLKNEKNQYYTVFGRYDLIYTGDPIELSSTAQGKVRQVYIYDNPASKGSPITQGTISFSEFVPLIGGDKVSLEGVSVYSDKAITATTNLVSSPDLVTKKYHLSNGKFVKFGYTVPTAGDEFFIIPVNFHNCNATLSVSVKANSSAQETTLNNVPHLEMIRTSDALVGIQHKGMHYLCVASTGEIKITVTALQNVTGATGGVVQVGDPVLMSGLNVNELDLDSAEFTVTDQTSKIYKVLKLINDYTHSTSAYQTIRGNIFNYLHDVDFQEKCPNPHEPISFFEPTHIYHEFIIPQLNIDTDVTKADAYKISVNKFSIK